MWLARWNADDCPEPTIGDDQSVRRFLRLKYIDKKWYKAPPATRKDHEEPKTEPLTNILGNNILPIRVDSSTNASKIAQFAAFDSVPQKVIIFQKEKKILISLT